MRKTFFTLLLASFMSLSASAQQAVKAFPKLTMAKAPLAAPAYVPSAIDDKALGTKIYATQVTDESKYRSWLSFYDKNAYNLNRIKIYENEMGSQNHGLFCGAMADDKYYGFYGSYSENYRGPFEWFGYEYFVSVDVRTGELEVIKDMRTEVDGKLGSDPVYMNQTGDQKLPVLLTMSYNPADGLLYLIAKYQKDEYTNAQTQLYTVDPETGDFSLVTTLDDIIFNFCFDYDGNMYTLEPYWKPGKDEETGQTVYTWSGTYLREYDSNFEQIDGKSFRVKTKEGQDAYMQYYGAMTFNHSNGDLYITCPVASDNSGNMGYDYLIKIDPNTGKYIESMSFMSGNEITGLYIPYYAADAREAAARVSGLATAPDAAGNMNVELSWTNPSKAWNGDDLSELAEVQIYRKNADFKDCALSSKEIYDNSTLVATVAAGNDKIGNAMTWKDENPNQGINVYYVVPCRVSGEKGVPDSIRCVAGLDIPGVPTDVTATAEGAKVKLTWKAPVDGKNNGYINPAALKYDIVRNPGNVQVATDIEATEFTDESIANENRAKVTYSITAKNEAGVGDAVTTAELEAGAASLPPVSYMINSAEDANQWTSLEGWGGDGQKFEWAEWKKSYRLITGGGEGNDWAISPAFRLEAGKTYRISSSFRNDYDNVGHTIGRYVGMAPTEAGMTNKIGEEKEYSASSKYENNPIIIYDDEFTPTESGTYYFGFKVSDNTDYDVIYLYGVEVEQVFAHDLKAESLNLLGNDCVSGDNNQATVEVSNGGTEDVAAGAYKVMVIQKVDGTEYARGTVENTPAVRSGSTVEIPVTFMPMEEGKYEFACRVIYDADDFDGNNTSDWKELEVLPFGENTPWSLVINDGDEWEYTYFPFSYADPTDGSQSLYTRADFADKGDVTNIIERIGYSYTGQMSDALNVDNVTVWMANTDLAQFTDGNAWVDESTLTQVFNGNLVLYPGAGNMLSIQLDQPFTYDPAKNLLICVEHSGSVTTSFPALWKTFNENGMRNRSIRYWSSMSNKYAQKAAPVLYVGFTPNRGTGINDVNASAQPAVYFDALSGKLVLNGSRADVYDLSGKLLRSYSNVDEARPSLPAGMYIIKAHAADGKTQSLKLNIK